MYQKHIFILTSSDKFYIMFFETKDLKDDVFDHILNSDLIL